MRRHRPHRFADRRLQLGLRPFRRPAHPRLHLAVRPLDGREIRRGGRYMDGQMSICSVSVCSIGHEGAPRMAKSPSSGEVWCLTSYGGVSRGEIVYPQRCADDAGSSDGCSTPLPSPVGRPLATDWSARRVASLMAYRCERLSDRQASYPRQICAADEAIGQAYGLMQEVLGMARDGSRRHRPATSPRCAATPSG